MQLIRGPHDLRRLEGGCALTIGNFDGVHLGHQHVVGQTHAAARRLGIPAVGMCFEPMPREFFQGDSAPPRLSRFREKYEALAAAGLDALVCMRFDRRMAETDPEDFVESFLVRGLGVRHVVVGADFRFGRDRAGDLERLEALGEEHGFTTEPATEFEVDGRRVSSTRVREALADGRMELASALLGRRYSLSGRVRTGRRLGRELGYPTANIGLGRRRLALSGIFAVRVHGLGRECLGGVASVGTRPTVEGSPGAADTRALLEVHLFDLDGDIYGERLTVEFVARARDEVRFDSLDALREQMQDDERWARQVLACE